jgi:hypothetical protein
MRKEVKNRGFSAAALHAEHDVKLLNYDLLNSSNKSRADWFGTATTRKTKKNQTRVSARPKRVLPQFW